MIADYLPVLKTYSGKCLDDGPCMVFLPRERLKPSQWVEKYVVLGDYSEEKGPYRLRRAPHVGPILDLFIEPEVEEIVFQKSAQIAGSTIMFLAGAYFTHQDPCPMGFVLADQDTSGYMCRERFQKLFEDSPQLSELRGSLWRDGELKTKNGAYAVFLWASSVMQLGSKSLRIMFLDEIDKPGYYAKSKEASALSLAAERKETFYRFKLFKTSTPTVDSGNMAREMASCDVIYDFHVPCPFCGQYQPLRWSEKYADGFKDYRYRDHEGKMRKLGKVVWKGGRNATDAQVEAGAYKCGTCGRLWDTTSKNKAVEQFKVVPRTKVKGKPRKVGVHIWRLYSLLGKSGSIPKLIRAFIDAVKSGDPKQLQGFVNSTLGENWKETLRKAEAEEILKSKCDLPKGTVPGSAVALVAGIDVQKYGFWYTVWAFSIDYESWLVDYGFIAQWEDVYNLLFERRFPVSEKGVNVGIWRAGIDTGGGDVYEDMVSQTEQTYLFLRTHGRQHSCRVWGTKGSSHPLPSKVRQGNVIDKTPSGKPLKTGIQLMMLDTDALKDTVHYRIAQGAINGVFGAHLHAETGIDFAKQISAEEKRINENGQPEWVVISRNNHLLDASVIAHAVSEPDWFGGIQGLRAYFESSKDATQPNKTENKRPSPPPRRGHW